MKFWNLFWTHQPLSNNLYQVLSSTLLLTVLLLNLPPPLPPQVSQKPPPKQKDKAKSKFYRWIWISLNINAISQLILFLYGTFDCWSRWGGREGQLKSKKVSSTCLTTRCPWWVTVKFSFGDFLPSTRFNMLYCSFMDLWVFTNLSQSLTWNGIVPMHWSVHSSNHYSLAGFSLFLSFQSLAIVSWKAEG